MAQSKVNVHARALRAAERVGTSDTIETPTTSQSWWRDYFKWEILTVAGREVKGFVVHPIIAAAILGLMATLGLSVRSELNWQHDQLVILATQKADAEKQSDKDRLDRANQDSADKAWRELISKQMAKLELTVQNQKREE